MQLLKTKISCNVRVRWEWKKSLLNIAWIFLLLCFDGMDHARIILGFGEGASMGIILSGMGPFFQFLNIVNLHLVHWLVLHSAVGSDPCGYSVADAYCVNHTLN